MTSAPSQNDGRLVAGSRLSDDVEERFWAALSFAIDDILPSTAFDPKASKRRSKKNTPLSSPTIALGSLNQFVEGNLPSTTFDPNASRKKSSRVNPPSPRTPQRRIYDLAEGPGDTEIERSNQSERSIKRTERNPNSLRVRVPVWKSGVSATRTPITAIPRAGLTPLTSTAQCSPMVEGLVTSFLDSLKPKPESEPGTPLAAVIMETNRDSMIVESEVLIQVVEDMTWNTYSGPSSPVEENALTRFSRSFELVKDDPFKALQIPLPPIAVPTKSGFDVPSAFVANGPASCAQELDALWRMRWDRLFARDMYY